MLNIKQILEQVKTQEDVVRILILPNISIIAPSKPLSIFGIDLITQTWAFDTKHKNGNTASHRLISFSNNGEFVFKCTLFEPTRILDAHEHTVSVPILKVPTDQPDGLDFYIEQFYPRLMDKIGEMKFRKSKNENKVRLMVGLLLLRSKFETQHTISKYYKTVKTAETISKLTGIDLYDVTFLMRKMS